MFSWISRRVLCWTVAALFLIVLWDATGLDLPIARLFGTPEGFPLRGSHAFTMAFHEIPRTLSSLLVAALIFGVFKPWGFLGRLSKSQRVQLAVSIVGAMLTVTALKRLSATSCPWDVSEFGGMASYVSHWTLGVRDGGPGHCFPAGHASAAFGFLAGWFVIRRAAPEIAARWLTAALVLGLALGFAQQLRGAHYMSHTLWSGFICWSVGAAVDLACHAIQFKKRMAPVATSDRELQP